MKESDLEKLFLYLMKESRRSLQEINEMTSLTPQQTDLYRTHLAAIYALLNEEKARIDKRRPEIWLSLKHTDEDGVKREKVLSIKDTDMYYDMTDDGKRRIELKARLNGIEQMLHALAARMRRLNTEARTEF